MARFPLNFAEIQERSFPVYPPGAYVLRVHEAKQEAAKSGELKETIIFEIMQGPGASNEFAGKKIYGSYSLQQKAGFRIERLLAACGVPKERMGDLDDQELVGCVIRVEIGQEVYNGRNVNRIQNEEPAQAQGPGNGQSAAPQGFQAPPTGFVPPPPPPSAPPAPAGWGQWQGAQVPTQFAGAAPAPPPAKPMK